MASDTDKDTDVWGTGTSVEVYVKIVSHMTGPPAKAIVDSANSYLSFDSPSTFVLDNGCGPGPVMAEIAKRYPNVKILATDLSPGMIEKVSEQGLPNVSTEIADGMDLSSIRANYPDGFSHVLSNFMNQFCTDPFHVLTEMMNVTRPGGVVGIGNWGKAEYCDVIIQGALEVDPKYKPVWFVPNRTWPENAEELTKVFEKYGLTEVKSERLLVGYPFSSLDEFIWYLLDGKNPGMETILNGFRKDHGQQGVEKIRALVPDLMKKKGWDYKKLRLEVFITTGRKM